MTDPGDFIDELLSWGATFADANWAVAAAVRVLGQEWATQDQYGLRKVALLPKDRRFWNVDLEWVEGSGGDARFGVVTLWVTHEHCPVTVEMFNAAIGPGFAEPPHQTETAFPDEESITIQTWVYDPDPRFQLQITFAHPERDWLIREARIGKAGTWTHPPIARRQTGAGGRARRNPAG